MDEPPTPPPSPYPGSTPDPVPGPALSGREPSARPPVPQRHRPSAWWFAPGIVFLALAGAAVIALMVIVVGMLHTDGYVQADGARHRLHLDDTGTHMLFLTEGAPAPTCKVFSAGRSLPVEIVHQSDTTEADGYEWQPFASFDSPSEDINVTCVSNDSARVRVGAPAGDGTLMAVGILAFAALGLGLLGVIVLVFVAILYFTRPRRPVIA